MCDIHGAALSMQVVRN